MVELINRPDYLNQLIQNKDVDLVKIVTGIRRCGKSSLLDLFHKYLLDNGIPASNIIHMNMESLRFRELTNHLAFYDFVSKLIVPNTKNYLIFDELQAVEHWEKAIESFRLDYDVDIYITGSNAYLLSTEFSTLLSGRVVLRDIFQRNPGLDQTTLQKIVLFLCSSIGSITSPNRIGNVLTNKGNIQTGKKKNIAGKTVERYISILRSAYIFFSVSRYDVKRKQLLKTLGKNYIIDLGFRNMLLGYRDADRGHIIENFKFN